jgi:hypothetical protein
MGREDARLTPEMGSRGGRQSARGTAGGRSAASKGTEDVVVDEAVVSLVSHEMSSSVVQLI